MTGEMGSIYTIHFDKPLGTSGRNAAQHYTGWAKNWKQRFARHQNGTSGVPIINAALRAGITFQVVDVRRGTRDDERRMKRNGHHVRRCSICKAERTAAKAAAA